MAKEIEILDDEMKSRYEKIYGEHEVCFALVEIFNMMASQQAQLIRCFWWTLRKILPLFKRHQKLSN